MLNPSFFFFSMYEGEKMLTEIVYFTGSIFFSPLNGNLVMYSPPKAKIYWFMGTQEQEGDSASPHKLKNGFLSDCPIE